MNTTLSEQYTQALQEFQQNNSRELLEHILQLAVKLDDPVELSRSYATLAQYTNDPAEASQYWLQAATVTALRRHEPQKAIPALKKALEQDPENLQAYILMQNCLENTKQWEKLIALNKTMLKLDLKNEIKLNPIARAQTWTQIAQINFSELQNMDDALTAVNTALTFQKNNAEIYRLQYEILASYKYKTKEELIALQNIVNYADNPEIKLDAIRKLSTYYADRNLHFAKMACQQAKSFVLHNTGIQQRTPKFKIPSEELIALTSQEWETSIYPHSFPKNLTPLLALTTQHLLHNTRNELHEYNISLADRMNPEDQTLINNINKALAAILGFPMPPEIYTANHIQNPIELTLLTPAAIIVNTDKIANLTSFQLCYLLAKTTAFTLLDLNPAYFLSHTEINNFLKELNPTLPQNNATENIIPESYIRDAHIAAARFAFLCAQSFEDIQQVETPDIADEIINYACSPQRIALGF